MGISPYIYISYRCNNNCIFCSEADEYMEGLKLKTIKQVKKEVSEARKHYNFVNFMGREPTLRKDFIEILEFTKKLDFKQVGFTTNGRLLAYKDFVKKIFAAGVNQIVVSLNGATSEVHDSQTRVSGSFSQTIMGIKNILDLRKENFSLIINLLLTKMNYLELPKMINLVKDLGIKEINILNAAPLSKRSRSKKIIMKMSELGQYVINVLKDYKTDSSLKFLLVEFLPCALPKEGRKYFFPCLEKNPEKVRIHLCQNCLYSDKCDGVLKSYIDLYGTKEFRL